MSLISRIVLLVLAVPFVLAHGDGCGNNQFKYVLCAHMESGVLTRVSGGTRRTSVFPEADPTTPPGHLPTPTVPTTGRGTLERAAVLLTSPLIPSLLLSVAITGIGAPAPFVATLPRPVLPPNPPSHPIPPESPVMMTAMMMTRMERVERVITTSASLPRSVNSVTAMWLLAPRVSPLALSPA